MDVSDTYILDADGKPVEVDTLDWAKWFESIENRRVARTEVMPGICVSTVFLGLDHSFDDGPPVLWETLVQGGKLSDHMERYTSRAGADEGHERIVRMVQEAENPHD